MIYPADLAAEFKSRAGETYRPSNGTEGEFFVAYWCERCRHYADGACDLLTRSYWCDIEDPDYPTEWQYADTGQPTCTAWAPEEKP